MRLQLLVWAAVCLGADLLFQLGMRSRLEVTELRPAIPAPIAAPAIPKLGVAGRQPALSPIVLEARRTRSLPPTVIELFPQFRIRQRINAASAPALAAIPGFSDRAAESLVSHREEHGPFGHRAELLDVKWIGWTTYLRLLEFITLDRVQGVGGDEPDP